MSRHVPNIAERYPLRYDDNGKKVCRGCGGPISKPRICWCSDTCINDALSRTNWGSIRRRIFERDAGYCLLCKIDLAIREDRHTKQPGLWPKQDDNFRDLFECDHIIPVIEGGSWELENLRTLCRQCHKAETAKLRKRLAQKRKESDERAIPES